MGISGIRCTGTATPPGADHELALGVGSVRDGQRWLDIHQVLASRDGVGHQQVLAQPRFSDRARVLPDGFDIASFTPIFVIVGSPAGPHTHRGMSHGQRDPAAEYVAGTTAGCCRTPSDLMGHAGFSSPTSDIDLAEWSQGSQLRRSADGPTLGRGGLALPVTAAPVYVAKVCCVNIGWLIMLIPRGLWIHRAAAWYAEPIVFGEGRALHHAVRGDRAWAAAFGPLSIRFFRRLDPVLDEVRHHPAAAVADRYRGPRGASTSRWTLPSPRTAGDDVAVGAVLG